MKGAVILVTWRQELRRLHGFATSHHEDGGLPFAVLLADLGPNGSTQKAGRPAEAYRLPVHGRPGAARRPAGDDARGESRLRALLEALRTELGVRGLLRNVLDGAQDWLVQRWAEQMREFDHWAEVWRRLDPTAVVVSRGLPEGLIPALAAAQLGIPAFSLPHGMIERQEADLTPYGVTALSPFRTNENLAAGRSQVGAGGLLSFEEYEWTDVIPVHGSATGRVRVLLLASLMSLHVMGVTEIRRRLWPPLREVLDAREDVLLDLKSHPGDQGALSMTCPPDLAARINWLPPRSDLRDAFRSVRGVLLVGPNGSATVHVALSGLPTAVALTDFILSDDFGATRHDRLVAGLPVLRSTADIVLWIDSLDSQSAVTSARERAENLRTDIFAPVHPSFTEIIAEAASRQVRHGRVTRSKHL